jgi:hypothetical protein
MNPTLIKTAIKLIGPDTIKSALISLIQAGIEQKNKVELQDGETDAVLILYENSGQSFAGLFTVNDTYTPPRIVRAIEFWPLDQIAENLVKTM